MNLNGTTVVDPFGTVPASFPALRARWEAESTGTSKQNVNYVPSQQTDTCGLVGPLLYHKGRADASAEFKSMLEQKRDVAQG